MEYLRRTVDQTIDELFPDLPAIALDGAKAVGKTETASQRAASIVRLDDPGLQQTVRADPGSLLRRPRPLLIDEWQRVSEIWDAVRRQVDEDPREDSSCSPEVRLRSKERRSTPARAGSHGCACDR